MSYSIILIEKFKKEAKRLIKKYPSLKKELVNIKYHFREISNNRNLIEK